MIYVLYGQPASGKTTLGQILAEHLQTPFVIDGDEADYFLLANKGGVLFLVDAKDKGIEINKLTSVDKTRSYLELNLNSA